MYAKNEDEVREMLDVIVTHKALVHLYNNIQKMGFLNISNC